jgi:two-component system cell cycle response regulator DivK
MSRDEQDATRGAYDFYSDVLAEAGYSVAGAGDGESALAAASRVRPDLVLLDIGLPKIDKYQVARRLRANPETRDIPVVALTGFVVDGVEHRALEAGCDAVLFKPCPTADVLGEIDARLRRPRG